MNFIRHYKGWLQLLVADDRLTPHHVSLYFALLEAWNLNYFRNPVTIYRTDVMRMCKIGSAKTYLRCLKELSTWRYIRYKPSFNPQQGSKVHLYRFDTGHDTAGDTGDDTGSDTGADTAGETGSDTASETADDTGDETGSSTGTDTAPGTGSDTAPGTGGGTASETARAPIYKTIKTTKNSKNSKNKKNAYGTINETSDFDFGRGPNTRTQATRSGGHHRRKENREPGGRGRGAAAIPASLEEVQAYFLEIQSTALEAEKFFNHYQSNGWQVGGRTPMQDWRASAYKWKLNAKKFANEQHTRPRPGSLQVDPDTDYEEPL